VRNPYEAIRQKEKAHKSFFFKDEGSTTNLYIYPALAQHWAAWPKNIPEILASASVQWSHLSLVSLVHYYTVPVFMDKIQDSGGRDVSGGQWRRVVPVLG
jgi:hypothetical protein